MPDSPADLNQRHLFIDLYRTFVILLMLEGHAVRAVLSLDLQKSELFQYHEFLHGLSAPAFLFGAGLTFVISTRRRWEEYHHWGAPLARRVRRLVLILLLGLALHLPLYSFRKLVLEGTPSDYLQLFQSDVLSCIGIGLLALHGLVFFFRDERKFYALVFASVVIVVLLTPIVWENEFLGVLPIPLAQLLNGRHGSWFPLFPYVGFLLAGVLVSWEYLVAVRNGRGPMFMKRLAIVGGTCVAAGVVLDAVPVRLYPYYDFWNASPNYFLIRIGLLMLFLAAVWWLGGKMKNPRGAATVLGRESLAVYVAHLLILHGSAMNPSLNVQMLLGMDNAVGTCLLVAVVLIAAMFLFALAWNTLKRRHAEAHHLILALCGGIFLYFFFTRDF